MPITETYKGPRIDFGLLMKKKVVVFDMDGVLLDSTAHVANFVFETFPSLTQSDVDELLTGNFHEGINRLTSENKAIDESPEQKDLRNKEYTIKKLQMPLYAGIQKMLDRLHQSNYILTINTSASNANSLAMLEKTGIAQLFDFVATKETSLSKVEKFKVIADKYKVATEDMIFVTDTLGDVREAEEVGVPTIAVTWGAHSTSYFTREPHENLVGIVDSVDRLEDMIKGNLI